MTLRLASAAFADGGAIPSKYTCEGANISPPLSWSGIPVEAKSLVLIVDDPDAPDPKAPRVTWVHWVLYDLPTSATILPEDADKNGLPPGAKVGLNDWKQAQYGGPCPPIGRHRYFHKLYALDIELSKLRHPTKAEVEAAMRGHVLGEAKLIGTYQKGR
jgi:Raf kinase inhibitor-like YbhB/YbcL family protein